MAGSLALAIIGGWLLVTAILSRQGGSFQASVGLALVIAALVLPFV